MQIANLQINHELAAIYWPDFRGRPSATSYQSLVFSYQSSVVSVLQSIGRDKTKAALGQAVGIYKNTSSIRKYSGGWPAPMVMDKISY